jgi:hypothetical protein
MHFKEKGQKHYLIKEFLEVVLNILPKDGFALHLADLVLLLVQLFLTITLVFSILNVVLCEIFKTKHI